MGVSKEVRRQVFESQNHRCAYCGCEIFSGAYPYDPSKPFDQNQQATVDHMMPKSVEEDNSFDNLVGACYQCNSTRGNMLWQDFYHLIVEPEKTRRERLAEYYTPGVKAPFIFHAVNQIRKRYQSNFALAA
jgi:5-methylcytosine-specific restriction endonuclease McrA